MGIGRIIGYSVNIGSSLLVEKKMLDKINAVFAGADFNDGLTALKYVGAATGAVLTTIAWQQIGFKIINGVCDAIDEREYQKLKESITE